MELTLRGDGLRPRFHRVRTGVLAATLACLLAILAPATAFADFTHYHDGNLAALSTDGDLTRTTLDSSHGWPDGVHSVKVAAHYAGGLTLYGSWVQGWSWTCQSWAGGVSNKGAMIHNPHSVTQNVDGGAGWLGPSGPFYC